jgi:hypothetical protein
MAHVNASQCFHVATHKNIFQCSVAHQITNCVIVLCVSYSMHELLLRIREVLASDLPRLSVLKDMFVVFLSCYLK